MDKIIRTLDDVPPEGLPIGMFWWKCPECGLTLTGRAKEIKEKFKELGGHSGETDIPNEFFAICPECGETVEATLIELSRTDGTRFLRSELVTTRYWKCEHCELTIEGSDSTEIFKKYTEMGGPDKSVEGRALCPKCGKLSTPAVPYKLCPF